MVFAATKGYHLSVRVRSTSFGNIPSPYAAAAAALQDARPVIQNIAVAEVTHATAQRRARRHSSAAADGGGAAGSDGLRKETMEHGWQQRHAGDICWP